MPLTQGAIVREAIALLDEEGIERLSLRRLAARLGVRAPTLYWHVRDKRELLDLMAAEMFRETFDSHRLPGPGQPWEAWLADRARALRGALLLHRDSARVLAGNRPPPAALEQIEGAVGALVKTGFLAEDALRALVALGAFVMGEVLDTQGEAARQQAPLPADGLVRDERGEALALLSSALPAARGSGPEGRFEFGLALLIDGLRAHLDRQGARTVGPSDAALRSA